LFGGANTTKQKLSPRGVGKARVPLKWIFKPMKNRKEKNKPERGKEPQEHR